MKKKKMKYFAPKLQSLTSRENVFGACYNNGSSAKYTGNNNCYVCDSGGNLIVSGKTQPQCSPGGSASDSYRYIRLCTAGETVGNNNCGNGTSYSVNNTGCSFGTIPGSI
ncbi:MAG: hypothetical protein GY756_22760 [bacterium]|nr:hypothetical protein [bacterium]